MQTNGDSRFAHARHVIDEQFDALKSSVQKLADRVMTTPSGEPSRVKQYATKTSDMIKAHPYLAIGVAFGLGYAIVRIARR